MGTTRSALAASVVLLMVCAALPSAGLSSALAGPRPGTRSDAPAAGLGGLVGTDNIGSVPIGSEGNGTAVSWPMFLYDDQHTAANLQESTLSPSNVSHLSTLWSFPTTGGVTDSPAVVNGTAYFGGWDGDLDAVNADTGQLDWQTSLGGSYDYTGCHQPGISASPTVWNNTVFIGGGNPSEYAVNASTGKILWSIDLANISGSSTPWTAYKTWSSALIVNGSLYVGTASGCDDPLVRSSLLQIDLATHQVEHIAFTVAAGDVGNSIWSSPSYDPGTNTVWATTGNGLSDLETYSRSIMAFDASNVSRVVGYAQEAAPFHDYDFGDGATIFHDAAGTPMVVALNKNGVAYAFNISTFRGNVSGSPAWTAEITTVPGASYSPPAFDGSMLYFGSSNTTLPNGTIAAGTIRAVYPGNGTTKWLAPTPLSVWGGLTYADGLVAAGLTGGDTDASQGGLLVLNASDGRTLFYRSNAAVWGEPIIVNGEVLYGSGDLSSTGGGSVTALALPFAGSLSTTVTERQPEASYGLRLLLEGGVLPYDASWTFGDGTVAYGLGASHSFDRPGVFHASVRVRDAAGASLTINFTLNGTAPAVAPAAAGVPLLELGIVAGAAILAAAVLVVYVVTRRRRRSAGVGSPPPPTGRPPEAG